MDLHVSKSTQDSLGFFNATPLGQQQNGSKLSLSLLVVAGNPTVSKHFSIPASAPGHDCEINLEGRKLLPECVPLPCEAPHKVGVSLIFIHLYNTAARPHLYHLNMYVVLILHQCYRSTLP